MANAEKSSADFIEAVQNVLASEDATARKKMLGVAMQATAMLETPVDAIWKIIMSVSAMRQLRLIAATNF